jgi:hypothetical protein
MREWLRRLDGTFEMHSDGEGTMASAILKVD